MFLPFVESTKMTSTQHNNLHDFIYCRFSPQFNKVNKKTNWKSCYETKFPLFEWMKCGTFHKMKWKICSTRFILNFISIIIWVNGGEAIKIKFAECCVVCSRRVEIKLENLRVDLDANFIEIVICEKIEADNNFILCFMLLISSLYYPLLQQLNEKFILI